ncbi:glutathione transferase GstA [Pseudomonas sp. UL073]|uniref:Glutathione transferase GstA n=1 Tax=Zestomonas insulae TaxID=2809017 RepID=A0ABS2IIW7_9GAMM|nr:glutathione transferase GstA [Pseudomonas insulae]MBM7062897.1 glutathione transferase GstA [Pseudomonas insulae]
MKLYYSPGACSLSPHIVLSELGLPHDLVKVDLKAHQTADGADFYGINPKGYVPALQLDNGQVLTEGPAIVQYLADQKPDAGLLPAAGTLERARVQEWLNFIGTELHKGFSPLFRPDTPEEVKIAARTQLGKRFGYVDKALTGKDYLTGDQFSVADAYLYTIANWTFPMSIDLSPYANVGAFHKRVSARPAVQAAMKAEGLLKG